MHMRLLVMALAGTVAVLPGCEFFGPATFSVNAPGAGDEVAQGGTTAIRWSVGASAATQVRIAVERNGEEVFLAAAAAANDGSEDWFVPSGAPLGGGYRITIDDGAQTVVGGAFSIIEPRPRIGITEDDLAFPQGAIRDTFQVFNDGPEGTVLEFRVESNRSWLLVSPQNGTSTSRNDRVTITVEIVEARLQAGPNNGRITVEATNATGVEEAEIDVVANRPIQ